MSLSRKELANVLLVTSVLSLLLSRPTAAAKIKCFKCTNRNQQCYESFACEGDYCVSQYTIRKNKEVLFTKYCENVAPDGVPIKVGCRGSAEETQETCYCNDKDFCNSAHSLRSTALPIFTLLIPLLSTITVVHSMWY